MKKTLTLLLGMLLVYSCSTTSDGTNTTTDLLPTLTTTTASAITTITATSGGAIITDGGATIIARGVVWSTSTNPTITLSTKTTDGFGTGSFSSVITGLKATTTYYVRAYATNTIGTGYGSEVSFTTSDSKITVVPFAPENLTGEATSTTAIHLMWTDRSTNETGFKIERKLEGGTFAVVGTTATDITTYSDTNLIPSTIYIYRVYSHNEVGYSPTYSNELTLTTTATTIAIGTQTWTTKNLDAATYSDGTVIPQVTDPIEWANLTTGAWCYYKNDPANGAVYGKMYNWYAVAGIWNEASKTDVDKRKKLTLTGWHIPSDTEWTTLTDYLGGEAVAGGKMKETGTAHWNSPNTAATNSSGFTALPGGSRYYDGLDGLINIYSEWWSSSETNSSRFIGNDNGILHKSRYPKIMGYYVRCIRD